MYVLKIASLFVSSWISIFGMGDACLKVLTPVPLHHRWIVIYLYQHPLITLLTGNSGNTPVGAYLTPLMSPKSLRRWQFSSWPTMNFPSPDIVFPQVRWISNPCPQVTLTTWASRHTGLCKLGDKTTPWGISRQVGGFYRYVTRLVGTLTWPLPGWGVMSRFLLWGWYLKGGRGSGGCEEGEVCEEGDSVFRHFVTKSLY